MNDDAFEMPAEPLAADAGGHNGSASADPVQAVSDALSDEARSDLRARFERWLDRLSAGEPAPDGLPPEVVAEALAAADAPPSHEADLYTLFASLTFLTGEVRLQGRAFKQLADTLGSVSALPDRLSAVEAAQDRAATELAEASDRLARLASAGERASSGMPDAKDVLSLVFDLQARLERGLDSFDDSVAAARQPVETPGFIGRLFGGRSDAAPAIDTDALREGYQLTLSRVEAALRQWGVQRVGEVGEPFDPGCMQAVDVANESGVDEGTILEVYRSGYVCHGRVLETAKVKVSKQG